MKQNYSPSTIGSIQMLQKRLFLLFLIVFLHGTLFCSILAQTITTDKSDYLPGETVIISGSGFSAGETVKLILDHLTFDHPDEYLSSVADISGNIFNDTYIIDPADLGESFLLTATGQGSNLVATTTFTDSGGSYTLKWYAADPAVNKAPYLPTYPKLAPGALPCSTPSGGIGRANNPIADAIAFASPANSSDLDAVTSLAPKNMALCQIVPFFMEITVSGSTSPENGVITFTNDWLAKTTSGKDFGFEPDYGLYCAFVDYGDPGNTDPLGNAKVDSYSATTKDIGTSNERIQGTVQVSGLDDGDRIIVELWVVLKCSIPSSATGNVQTSLQSAHTGPINTTGSSINTGNQTVPLLQVQEFFSAEADLQVTKSASNVCLGENISYTITVTNNSADVVANGIVATDVLGSNLTFVSASGAPYTQSGQTVIFQVGALSPLEIRTLTVVATPTASVTVNNTVSITAITSDKITTNNSASTTTSVYALPVCSITGESSVAPGLSTEWCATAGMTDYEWTGPDGFTGTTQCVQVSKEGDYSVTITNANGCKSTCTKKLTFLLSCSLTGPSPVCPASTNKYETPVPIPSGYSYSWSLLNNTNNATIQGATNGTFVNVLAGSTCHSAYTVSLDVINIASGLVTKHCEKTVSVDDTDKPIIADKTDYNLPGCNTAWPTVVSTTWSDNCSTGGTINGVPGAVTKLDECTQYIDYTFNVTDDCDNDAVTTVTRVTRHYDETKPEFSIEPEDLTVSCMSTVPEMTTLAWTDNCDGNGKVTGYDKVEGTCPTIITRTWYYKDACGNEANASQVITVNDKIAPVFTNPPADAAYECLAAVPAMADLGWTDNCGGNGTSEGFEKIDGSCPTIITRSWIAKDECNNSVTHFQTITVQDITKPVFTAVPKDATVECIGDVPVMTKLAWTDNCDGSGEVTGTDKSDGKTCPETITRTWIYTDKCGNPATATQVITVIDTKAPVFAAEPNDATVECIGDVPVMTKLAWTDNCDGSGEVTGTDKSDGKTCPETITRTWTYTDKCGNPATATQIITVIDTKAPVFAAAPKDATVECIGDVPAMTKLAWTDNCGETGLASGIENRSGTCPVIITRTWSTVDVCGNKTSYTQTITVKDNTAPVIKVPSAELTMECFNADLVSAWAATASATDNCDGLITITPEYVHSSCKCSQTILVTFNAVDVCGNKSFATKSFTVDDNTAPVFKTPPANAEYECLSCVPSMKCLSWTDNCGGKGSVSGTEIRSGTCPTIITRTWVAEDACGNKATYIQTITVRDKTAPVFATPPANIVVTCSGEVPMTKLKWTDNCDGSGEVTGTDKSAGSDPEVITRTWTYADACGNTSTAKQTITFIEKSGIIFVNPPSDAKYSCIGDVPDMKDLSWSENCGTTGSSRGIETRTGTCPTTIVRKWTATDGHNNTITHTQTITVSDKTAPVFTNAPVDESYECMSAVPVMADLGWIDNCGTTGFAKGSESISGSCPAIITRTWSAEDLCGNKVIYTQDIIVSDKTDPVFEQQPADIKVMCKTAIPAMTSLKWTDNCVGSGEVPGVDTQINKCLPVITRTWTYTDLCGNTASVSQLITIDNTAIPVFIKPPADKKYECISEVPAITDLGWTDNCGNDGLVAGTECKSGSCPTTIVRKWSIKDGLGTTRTHIQTITVDDNTPPVFLFAPVSTSYEHTADVPAMTDLEWTDNCGEVGFAKGTETLSCSCPSVITRRWTAQDGCGNKTTYIQQITITGDTGPTSVLNPILEVSLKAYPNPFVEVVNFELEMPFKSHVKIEIFSLGGALLKVVLDEDLESGDIRKIGFSAGKYPYSSFLYRIKTDYINKSGTIIRMK